MEVIRRRGQEEQGCVPPATGLGLYVKDISGQTQLDPVPLPDSAQEGEIAALGVVPPKAPSLLRIRRKVGGDDHPGACMVIKQEVTPSSQRAFTKLCQATTSEYPAQKMPGIPNEGELYRRITLIRQRVENDAATESGALNKRQAHGASKCTEQLSLQLNIIARDYQTKLCSYIQTFQSTMETRRVLLSERDRLLPIATSNALEAKVAASHRQCHDIVNMALAQLERDTKDLLTEFRSQHLKKKEKLPDISTDVLRAWLTEHFQHPYPTADEKRELIKATGLSLKQINQWFINARVRVWRPAVTIMMSGAPQAVGTTTVEVDAGWKLPTPPPQSPPPPLPPPPPPSGPV